MPNTKSAKKAMLTSAEQRVRNQAGKSAVKTAHKRVLDAVASGDKQASTESLQAFYAETDNAVRRGILDKNTAARKKSRTAKRVAAL